jgi:hypothetical protein
MPLSLFGGLLFYYLVREALGVGSWKTGTL